MLRTMLMVDLSGLIVSYSDGADSCCRNYTFHLRNAILQQLGFSQSTSTSMVASPDKTQRLLESSYGEYVRSPTPSVLTGQPVWYNNPRTTSRDQLTPVICYLAYEAYHNLDNEDDTSQYTLNRLISKCEGRFGFAQNNQTSDGKSKLPDFMTPDLWAIALRRFGKKTLPMVAVLDVFIFLSMLVKLWGPINTDGTLKFRMPGPGDTDDDNTNNILMAAQYTYDTPFSWLARKLYKKFRKSSHGGVDIYDALYAYHMTMGSPELANMAQPIVEKY